MQRVESLVIVILLIMFIDTHARVIQFDNQYKIEPSTPFSMSYKSGIFARDHFPFRRILSPFLTSTSSLHFDLKASVKQGNESEAIISVMIFNNGNYQQIMNKLSTFCSTDQQSILDSTIYHTELLHEERQSLTMSLNETSLYHFVFLQCPHEQTIIHLNGLITFKNPYGYMPGELFGIFVFHFILGAIYITVGIIWLVKCLLSRRFFGRIHFAISSVLILCILESVADFFDNMFYNRRGYKLFLFVASGIFIELTRKVIARLLVLLVCMGFGSIKRSLERQQWLGLSFYSLLYFAFTCLNDVATNLSADEYISDTWSSFTLFPVAILDALFYAWVFYSLTTTLVELSKKNQVEKIKLFKKIMLILVVYVVASIGLFALEGAYGFLNLFNKLWMMNWMFDASFKLIFCIVLCGIMYLCRPTLQSQIFLDSVQISSDAFDDMLDLIDDSDDLNSQNIILGDDDDMDMELSNFDAELHEEEGRKLQNTTGTTQQQQQGSSDEKNGGEEIIVL